MADVPYTPDSGAAGTEYQTKCALERMGHNVDMLCEDSFPRKIKHGNFHYLFELPTAYRDVMQRKLTRQHYDIIHVNQPHGYLAAKALRASGCASAFIHRSHGFEQRAEVELKPWREKYEWDERAISRRLASKFVVRALYRNYKGIARYADGHIVSASQCREFLHQKMNVPLERISVIPQAASDAFLSRSPAPMTADRLKSFLYVGQFTFFKAPMIVADVISRLAQWDREVRFTWVCSKEHHAKVRDLLVGDARDRIQLLDWMAQEDLVRIYDAHGVFLFPSFFEGFGKVFLEAMSRGLCVVAADNGGAHDVITNGVDGILTTTGDVTGITSQCQRLLANPADAIRISHAAATTAHQYTWSRVARETLAFYEDRIAAKAGQLRQ